MQSPPFVNCVWSERTKSCQPSLLHVCAYPLFPPPPWKSAPAGPARPATGTPTSSTETAIIPTRDFQDPSIAHPPSSWCRRTSGPHPGTFAAQHEPAAARQSEVSDSVKLPRPTEGRADGRYDATFAAASVVHHLPVALIRRTGRRNRYAITRGDAFTSVRRGGAAPAAPRARARARRRPRRAVRADRPGRRTPGRARRPWRPATPRRPGRSSRSGRCRGPNGRCRR